jgi:hypothetical protein
MGLARRLGQVGKAVRLAVVLILVAAGASFIAFVVWREPGQVSGSLTDVAEEVSPGPYRVGEFIVSLETGISRQTIENEITNNPDLALLADLANLDKHGHLSKSAQKRPCSQDCGHPRSHW